MALRTRLPGPPAGSTSHDGKVVQLSTLSFQGPSTSMPLCSFLGRPLSKSLTFRPACCRIALIVTFPGLYKEQSSCLYFHLVGFSFLIYFELRKKPTPQEQQTKHQNNVDNSPDLTPFTLLLPLLGVFISRRLQELRAIEKQKDSKSLSL